MKRLLACAALLVAVSACSQPAEEPAATAEEAEPAATMQDYAGAWNVTMADGSTHVTTNNADGTFTRTMPDGTSNGGTWTYAPEQSCWTTEGEEPACYTMVESELSGNLTLTNVADQSVVTASRVVEGMEEAPSGEGAAAQGAPAEAAPAE